jgi:hypothetical protein
MPPPIPGSGPHFFRGALTHGKHFAVVAGLDKILLAKLATLLVTLRVCNFLSHPLKIRNAAKSRRMRALGWRSRRGSNQQPPA